MFLQTYVDSLVDEVLERCEPSHVKALIFVEGHALNEGSEVLVDTIALKVLSH